MPYNRIDRISEEVKRELSGIIRDMKDPRMPDMASVVAVEVSRDLSCAKAYISVLGDEKIRKDAANALNSAAGYIRKEVGHRINLRNTPEFKFIIDNSIEYGAHINKILKEIN